MDRKYYLQKNTASVIAAGIIAVAVAEASPVLEFKKYYIPPHVTEDAGAFVASLAPLNTIAMSAFTTPFVLELRSK